MSNLKSYVPGQSGNPGGKPKGARDKIGKAFLEAMAADFDKNGKSVIADVRVNDPGTYLKVVAGLLPKDVHVTQNVSEGFVKLLELVNAGHGAALADSLLAAEQGQPEGVRH